MATATAEKAAPTEAEVLAAKEREIRKKYPRVVPGSIRKEEDGPHAGKITVEIKCAHRGCKEIRRVATSDLFQVKYCEEHTKFYRNLARRNARAEKAGDAKPAPKTKKVKKAKAKKVVKVEKVPDAPEASASETPPVAAE